MQLENYPLNLSFVIGNTTFHLQRMVLESIISPIPLHNHGNGCCEFHYILSGQGSILSDGTTYHAAAGSFYVTGPLISHAQTSDPGDEIEENCLYLKTTEKKQAPQHTSPALRAFLKKINHTKSYFLPYAPQFGKLMTAIFKEIQHKEIGYTIQIESLFREILVLLIRNSQKDTDAEMKKTSSLATDKTLLLIDEAFLYRFQDLTLNDLALQLNLSCRQTERLLKQYYGKTFQQKKTDARMAAAVLLLEKQLSITQVAASIGFSSIEHFSSSFKRYYGVSPSVYRKGAGLQHAGKEKPLEHHVF